MIILINGNLPEGVEFTALNVAQCLRQICKKTATHYTYKGKKISRIVSLIGSDVFDGVKDWTKRRGVRFSALKNQRQLNNVDLLVEINKSDVTIRVSTETFKYIDGRWKHVLLKEGRFEI